MGGVLLGLRLIIRAAAAGRAAATGRAALLAALLSGLPATPVRAQLSPNCLFNGRPKACAVTPGSEQPGSRISSLTVMDSDHRAYRLIKQEGSCTQKGTVIQCSAQIIPSNGFGTPIRARYRGTAYEGGYRHEYSSAEVSITYFFLD